MLPSRSESAPEAASHRRRRRPGPGCAAADGGQRRYSWRRRNSWRGRHKERKRSKWGGEGPPLPGSTWGAAARTADSTAGGAGQVAHLRNILHCGKLLPGLMVRMGPRTLERNFANYIRVVPVFGVIPALGQLLLVLHRSSQLTSQPRTHSSQKASKRDAETAQTACNLLDSELYQKRMDWTSELI